MSNDDPTGLLALLAAPAPRPVPGQLEAFPDERPTQLGLFAEPAETPPARPANVDRLARDLERERRRHLAGARSASTVAAARARAWLTANPA